MAFLAMWKRDPGIAMRRRTCTDHVSKREQECNASNLNDHMVLAGIGKVILDRRNPLAARHTSRDDAPIDAAFPILARHE